MLASNNLKQFGLIGYPLGHSFSADFFTRLFEREHISAHYTPYELSSIDQLEVLLKTQRNLYGLNVTSPYKAAVLEYATDLSLEVVAIGAANVLHIRRDVQGRIKGITAHNTDIIGFRDSLLPHLAHLTDSRALILGTGGAARSVSYVLEHLGLGCTLVSRSSQVGAIGYGDIAAHLSESRLIVQATPVGLRQGQVVQFPYDMLTADHLCYDLIYNPSETGFLLEAKRFGAQTKNGLEMLHGQALAAWKIWETP
ncbi:MAG: shikimate dehydrogenase [Porphyromonadaceae bacterium]|nr:shikimate dehydrogenase [Porphyromonadaceae bacterium]